MAELSLSLQRTENQDKNQEMFANFAKFLHRGGRWAYEWALFEGGRGGDSFWWEVGVDPVPNIKGTPRNLHLYFGVHPLAEIPTTNKKGEPTQANRVRGRIEHVAAINCLFADMDAKDFNGWKPLLAHLKQLQPKPSAVVNTGYGIHLYWFLTEPFPVYQNPENLKRAASLQYRWQEYTQSDPGAKDLARILRVPGTKNWKHGTQKPCTFQRLDFSCTYTLDELEAYLPADIATREVHATVEIKPIQDVVAESRKAKMALSLLKPERADDRESWVEIGMALTQLGDVGFDLWDEWSQQSAKYDEDDAKAKWVSFSAAENVVARKPITLSTLYYRAREDAADFAPEDETTLMGLLDEATDGQATIAQRRDAKKALAERLIWYPADIQDEIRLEAKKRKWLKAEFDKALDSASSDLGTKTEAQDEIDAVLLGETWLRHYPDSLRAGGEWFRYSDGIWHSRDDELIWRELVEVAKDTGIGPTISTINGAAQTARAFALHRDPGDWNPESCLLVVRNGVLDISKSPPEFFEWSNKIYNRIMLPVDYDPEAKAPVYERALLENFAYERDVVKFFLEFSGLALAENADYEISPWMSGPPGGGKSTILAGVNAVMGGYAGPVDLARLDAYAHGKTVLLDKKLIYAYEVDTRFLQNPGSLNAIISHEPIVINPKGKPEYQYTPRCAVMFAMNELPGVANPDSGIFRRIKVIPVAGRDSSLHDPTIRTTIEQDEAERSGMLNLFLEGLAAVRRRNLIAMPGVVEEATRDWHIDNDKVRIHIMERCERDPRYSIGATALYEDFKNWCRYAGVKAFSQTGWGRRMNSLNYKKVKTGGVMIYRGLRLKPQPSKTHEVSIDLSRATN